MKRAVGAALVCIAAHVFACALDWSVAPGTDVDDAGTADATADGDLIDGGTASDGASDDAVADSGNDLGRGPDTDTGVLSICNGVVCNMDEVCAYPLRDCGNDDLLMCVPRATFCGSSKVCGCDGVVYDNECAAAAAGTTAAPTTFCPSPPSTFDCRNIRYCSQTEVCVSRIPGQGTARCAPRNPCFDCGCLSLLYCGNDAGSCDGVESLYCDK
jgi:hypothetical protein